MRCYKDWGSIALGKIAILSTDFLCLSLYLVTHQTIDLYY